MLLLASFGFRDGRNVFEIHLDFFQYALPLLRFAFAALLLSDPVIAPEDFPNGACGTRQGFSVLLKRRVPREIVQDRSWSWCPLEILRWGITNGEHTRFYYRICLWVGGLTPKGFAP